MVRKLRDASESALIDCHTGLRFLLDEGGWSTVGKTV